MSPAWIRPRVVKITARNPRGRSYQVLYRRGGRGYAIETAGTFKAEKEARLRRDLVAGWLAGGLNPREELASLTTAPVAPRGLRAGRDSFLATRIDVASASYKVMRSATAWLTKQLGDPDPHAITVANVQETVHAMSAKLKPATVGVYVTYIAALLDYLGADPNPARSKHLRLPQQQREEVNPPTWQQFVAVLERMPVRYQLPLVVLEQTAMRIGELESLAWGDVDEQGLRFRLRSDETKTKRPRWVQLPAWLMPLVTELCPLDDRTPDRRVFRFNADWVRKTLAKACAAAGVPHFTPHDLRHRRATIWHHDGLPVRVLMERGGWSTSEIPIEVYSHLMPLDEAPIEALEALLVMPR